MPPSPYGRRSNSLGCPLRIADARGTGESFVMDGNVLQDTGRALVRALRDRGIVVPASGILCQQGIAHLGEIEAGLVQFMLLTPCR